MPKFKQIISTILLLLLVISVSLMSPPAQKTQAAVSYPVPHRSWIKLGIVAYQGSMTSDQIDWAAKNIDWLDNPHPIYLPQYKAKTNAPMLVYDNFYTFYVGDAKSIAMNNYAADNGLNPEDMFLHFDVPTTIKLAGQTYTLPLQSCLDANPSNPRACSRVPSYDWYGNAGDMSKKNTRVILNVNNVNYRNFLVQYERSIVDKVYNGVTYDGLFVDNSAPGVLTSNSGSISPGGTLAEYPGLSRTDASKAYDSDIVLVFQAVRNVFGTKGQNGSKLIVPNSSYDNWTQIFPYIDGVFREFEIQPTNMNIDGFNTYLANIAQTQAIGIPSIISSNGTGETTTDNPREKMTALSMYYMAALPSDYYCRQDHNGADPTTTTWFGALDYNVGQPKNTSSQFAFGIDPSSGKKDAGTGTVTNNGSVYTITDPSKNWPTDYWQGTTLIDSAKNTFAVYHNGSNWISFWNPTAPHPVSGDYSIGTFIYKIFGREYDNALVLAKPKPAWNTTEKGDPSATTHALPATADNPSGRYFKLNADGSLDASPITQISLRNAEGAILIKESALNRPSISKTVDKTSAAADETLTYTISYSNPTQTTYANAKIEDPIPSGTTYVDNSITGGATFDSANNKVTLTIGNLAPDASGNFSFQVRVQ